MHGDLEQTLARELREVADGVEVPALPPLPEQARPRPAWQPLLVAAAVLLVVLGAAAALTLLDGGSGIQPAPAPPPTVAPSPSPTAATHDATDAGDIPTSRPTVPYVLGTRLFVDGRQVPGEWSLVEGTENGWVALRRDGSYWRGYDAQPHRVDLGGAINQPPAVSPGGRYVGVVVDKGGDGVLTGWDQRPAGEGLGGTPVDPVDRDGVYTAVGAVTDDGLVITRGNGTSLLWRPLVDGRTVDLGETAPGQAVVGSTPAGLLVVDRSAGGDTARGATYLGDISPEGEIARIRSLPDNDELVASTEWLAWVPAGTLGGEVATVDSLRVQRLDGSAAGAVAPPDGWAFSVGRWTWEDADHLVAAVVDDRGRARMARCSPLAQACVLVDTP